MASQDFSTRITCRACGSPDLTELFSLGEQFVSDFVEGGLPKIGDPYPRRVPITLDLCRTCTLVQARHSPPPELLYRRHYHYRSGVTDTMRAALADVAEAACTAVSFRAGDAVLDIGSNDGTLLRCFPKELVRVGCEPAENLATPENYEDHGLDCIRGFWSADKIGIRFKIVTACGMLYDLEDPNQFIADVAKVLHPDGVFVAQLMCLRQMLRQNDVGNLAHEHLEFYTLESLVRLFARNGLEVYDVEENEVNGGSYRVFARRLTLEKAQIGVVGNEARVVQKALHAEKRAGLDIENIETRIEVWFLDQEEIKELLVTFLRREVARGKRVWIYGASTKGSVLMQWWGLDSTVIEAAADRDPAKWGKFTVGTGIPITSELEFRNARPDYALVLPYAFRGEFMRREVEWLAGGGKFVFPLPVPVVVSQAEGEVSL